MTTQQDSLTPPSEEFDFSGDSAVEVKEALWTITEVETKDTDSANGKGTQHILTFESDAFPYPVLVRQFVQYTPTDASKNVDWVKRSRGILKNIAKAAGLEGKYSLTPGASNYIVGRQVIATTRDGGDGFATLSKFKAPKASNGSSF